MDISGELFLRTLRGFFGGTGFARVNGHGTLLADKVLGGDPADVGSGYSLNLFAALVDLAPITKTIGTEQLVHDGRV